MEKEAAMLRYVDELKNVREKNFCLFTIPLFILLSPTGLDCGHLLPQLPWSVDRAGMQVVQCMPDFWYSAN